MKTYKLETFESYQDANHTVLYDVDVDSKALLTGVPYSYAYNTVLGVINDEDSYQEVCEGEMYCNITGLKLKQSHAEMQNTLNNL